MSELVNKKKGELKHVTARRKKLRKNNRNVKTKSLPVWAIVLIIAASLVLTLVYAVVIGVFAYLAVTDDRGYYDVTKNLEITSVDKNYYDAKNKQYVIEGVITNKTKKSFDDIEIEYYLYGKNKVILSVARSFIDDIGAEESWRFKAISDDDISEISSFKLIRIVEDSNYYNPGSMRVDPIGYED